MKFTAFPASRRGAIASLSLAMLLASFATSAANVALPTLAQSFGVSFPAVQWVVLAYLLAVTSLAVGAGRLGDAIGRGRLMRAGLLLFAAASFGGGLATELWLLIAARALQGMGAAILMAMSLALVGDLMPKDRTGSAMGLLGTVSAIGTALGPSLGGLLIAASGWQAIFLGQGVLALAALVLAWRHLPAARPAVAPAGIDAVGSALLAAALASYALAVTLTGSGTARGMLAAAAVAASALFARHQASASTPLVPAALVRDPTVLSGLASSALVSTVLMATLVVGPFYLTQALALNPTEAGLAMAAGPLTAALVGFPAGRLVDALGPRSALLAALAGIAASAAALALLPGSCGVAGYVLPMSLLTGHYALFQAANNAAVVQSAGAEQRGAASGLLNLARNFGLITGAAAMGAIFAAAAGTAELSGAAAPAIAHGMRVTYGVAAGLVVVALAIALRRARQAPAAKAA